jgi:hypothetical protein
MPQPQHYAIKDESCRQHDQDVDENGRRLEETLGKHQGGTHATLNDPLGTNGTWARGSATWGTSSGSTTTATTSRTASFSTLDDPLGAKGSQATGTLDRTKRSVCS